MEFKIDPIKLQIAYLKAGIRTRTELAERLGCTQQNLRDCYLQDASVFKRNFLKLCELLNVQPEEILK